MDFGEGSDGCPDHDCLLSRYVTGCALAVDLVSLLSRLPPTAAFESQHGLGCRTRMQLTAVVLCVSNQSLDEQLGFYRCFSALLNSLQNKVTAYLLHARPSSCYNKPCCHSPRARFLLLGRFDAVVTCQYRHCLHSYVLSSA